MKEFVIKVLYNEKVSQNYYLLKLLTKDFKNVVPGQFVEVLCRKENETDPYLRRPFSIMDIEKDSTSLLYKIVGRGTENLTHLRKNDYLSILGPLGKGFNINLDSKTDNVLVVSGGTGLAPVFYLIKKLKEMKVKYTFLYGIKSKKELPENILNNIEARIIFEDTHGLVTDYLSKLEQYTRCYTCGPVEMIRTVYKKLHRYIFFIEVSLEERMGCGFGVCYACPVERRDGKGYYRVCKDGPVFNAREIVL
ncbi:MAG: dihydroorotate dehydrogenase electron transfer subunit [Candidatus Hydrogenedentota bacterium]